MTAGSRRFEFIILAAVSTLTALALLVNQVYSQFFATYPFVVASTPSDAHIRINGEDVGKSPVTLEVKPGIYTVEVVRDGYETAHYAVHVSSKDANVVNLQLRSFLPEAEADAAGPRSSIGSKKQNSDLSAEVERLKEALLVNPEDAVSILLIREKLTVQHELIHALREDLKHVKEQGKWYLGSMIAIVVGLLGVIAALFSALRGKT